ncbi:lovastatin nonaketide synthase [Aspergillus californicus]
MTMNMTEPIAIVGSSCRFPGSATSPSKLWDLLKSPKDVVAEFPPDRLNLSAFYNENGEHHGCTDVKNRSYLLQDDYRHFDASFFRINPKEASGMDPQQRMLLETTYEAFESAGWPLETLDGSRTGVYVGVMTADFNEIQMRDPETLAKYTATGVARSILSNRISYAFNLSGPSMTIDTACSSSLVAVHLAVQGIRNGDATQAVVAGSTLLLDPGMYIAESNLHMLSADSRSRMWDKDANGYARGEGCAAILLKPLSKAIEDGDEVDCVIRSTAVNSDGRTSGITVPSAAAQTALIRHAYEKVGLDPVADRCQYFECHGTGTLAGDPVEAQAIHDAFFPGHQEEQGDPLYCGSVKTVIGHLEGCAGIASMLKVSLALQNKKIPPNMHFNEVNPSVARWYGPLCVPTTLLPWPETDGPLRVSVNSFGFGGTNAHAVLERYSPPPTVKKGTVAGPFTLSAKSRSALVQSMKQLETYISENPSLDMDSLGWTLQTRRSTHSSRMAIAALDRESLLTLLTKEILAGDKSSDALVGVKALPMDQPSKILGVFTGQGAQWPAMGRDFLGHCQIFRKSIEECEATLASLPEAPSWSLSQELSADNDSRISEAALSQPLCTAIQIALVDILRATGIEFDMVIGHSSGEIGAAYAAGIINRRDAMGIAYYRGVVSRFAEGVNGEKGAMLAVEFAGHVCVAASNSPTSVTLSGDNDAIQLAKSRCDRNEIFARLLRVNTAYHSHHMLPCSERYRRYLQQLNVEPDIPSENCTWYSSVYGHVALSDIDFLDQLKADYWVDNMVQPVLLSQAMESMLRAEQSIACAVEVGPHPALKGPVGQTIKEFTDTPLPYTGCLERGKSDFISMSAAVGYLWSYLGPSVVNFREWRKALTDEPSPRMLKNLPTYPWDHDQIYWRESRLSCEYRLGGRRPHELLGRVQGEALCEMSWINVLRLNEMPWLCGHTFQHQVVFPGAGYVSMAVQAATEFVRGRPIRAVEIQDMHIAKALVIEDSGSGVETVFTLHSEIDYRDIEEGGILNAQFSCHSSSDELSSLDKSCHGRLLVHIGPAKQHMLPPSRAATGLPPLDANRFFKAVEGLGIRYDGIFRAIHSINRVWGHATVSASWDQGDLDESYLVHPAVLDIAFQAAFATFVSIADKATATTFLPSSIKRIIIDPNQTYREEGETSVEIEARMVNSTTTLLEVDLNLHDQHNCTGIQVDGLLFKAVSEPQPSEDRLLFAKTVWGVDAAFTLPSPPTREIRPKEVAYIDAVERTAFFFLRSLSEEIRDDEIGQLKWHHQQLMRGIRTILESVRRGEHAVLKADHFHDTREIIDAFTCRYPDSVELALLTAVGDNLASVLRGQSEMLEHMLKDNMLGRLYMEGRGFTICNEYVAEFLRPISHKHPRAKILEIGAGTGGTTKRVLDTIGDAYGSYVYTDISAGFFEKASEKFANHIDKMEFKTLNVENVPVEQGFSESGYDVIIAANVLHATRSLSQTMQHTRSLLRPGGFLVLVEVTGGMLRETGLMAGLEGWWLGVDDGRFPSPGITVKAWDDLLRKTGFSGVDSVAYDMPVVAMHNCSVFVSRAIDERFELLRDPLAGIDLLPEKETPLVIIGGDTLPVSRAIRRIEGLLRRWTRQIVKYTTIDTIDPSAMQPGSNVLFLTELDKAIFSGPVSEKGLENLQELLGTARNVLWVTSGGRAEDPYSNMIVGIARALAFELPHVRMQVVDFDGQFSWDVQMIVNHLLRLVLLSSTYPNHDLLWVQEPEVIVSQGTAQVPRVVSDHDANENLNAKRRRVTKRAGLFERIDRAYDPSSSQFTLSTPGGLSMPGLSNGIKIDVRLSVALHTDHEAGRPCFLNYGFVQKNTKPVFALTERESSVVTVQPGEFWQSESNFDCKPNTLVTIGASLVASYILSASPPEGTILLYHPCEVVAAAVTEQASLDGRKVLLIAPESAIRTQLEWIKIHPLARPRDIRSLIPRDSRALWAFTPVAIDNLLSCLPETSMSRDFDARGLLSDQESRLEKAHEESKSLTAHFLEEPSLVNISDARSTVALNGLSTVTDWRRSGHMEVTVQPVTVGGIFSPSKAYLLVGMATELGQSLCQYMVKGGARHIVLCGRNPRLDARWLDDMRLAGANIHVVTMDVTDRDQVHSTISRVRETMPEIAGVANAALVLEDSLFINTAVANIQRQLQPKVHGIVYLDEAFHGSSLDFFIAFSSLGSVYGNPGQSIYHAANMFMASLIEKRRLRGQVGSVIDIGMISDVGYVAQRTREDAGIEEHLREQFYMPLAETEFHELFLQAVLAGHPRSSNSTLIMGIQHFVDDPNALKRPQWYENPRFSHMIIPPGSSEGPSSTSSNSPRLWRDRLENAQLIPEATGIYQDLFCQKIQTMMKVPAASIDVLAPLSDLGLDSLLAVEIRAWLVATMHIDVPILKILGRVSMAVICEEAAQAFLDGRVIAIKDNLLPVISLANKVSQDKTQESTIDSPAHGNLSHSTSNSESGHASPGGHIIECSASSISDFSEAPEKLVPFIPEYTEIGSVGFAQSSLHFMHKFLDDPTMFNVTAQYAIQGSLNVSRFSRALEKTLSQHQAFRACFYTEPGSVDLKQGIVSNGSWSLVDRFTNELSVSLEDIESAFQVLAKREWDLTAANTFQAILFSHSADSHTVVIGCHHIVMDGMSWHIFLRDLESAYKLVPMKPIDNLYLEFSSQQVQALNSGQLEESIQYWICEMDPVPDVLPLLPISQRRGRRAQRAYGNHTAQRKLAPSTVQQIKNASRSHQVTTMHFYLAIVQALLSRFLELDDLCIGVTDAGRGFDNRFADTVGHFPNLLPMRFKIQREASFADLLKTTRDVALNGFCHKEVPIDVVLEKLGIERSPLYMPLFQVAFNYRVGDLLERTLGNCTLNLVKYQDARMPYDLSFNVTQTTRDSHLVEVSSNDYLYSMGATEFILDCYTSLLENLSTDQTSLMKDGMTYNDALVDHAIKLGRGHTVHSPWPESLAERFSQVCKDYPRSLAIKDSTASKTYEELSQVVYSISSALSKAGAVPGSRVAVLCEPSIDTYATMLAILHIGAVYIPLDLSLPATRYHAMLDACQPGFLLHHSATATQANDHCGNVILIDISNIVAIVERPPIALPSTEGGFILFTSGSTGTPKGIQLSQHGIMNYAATKSSILSLEPGVKVLQQSSTGFDMSLAQAFNAFANAGTLVVASRATRGDPCMIADLMVQESINLTICTPSEYLMLCTYAYDTLRSVTSWKHACSGGEAVAEQLIAEMRRLEITDLSLTDCYGPTETSCAVTFRSISLVPGTERDENTRPLVGKVIPNCSIYILDEEGNPLPIGFTGEVCVGGCGVAAGYLDTEMNIGKFVRDPFAMPEDIARGQDIMYRTGDRGCLLEDGDLAFLGRKDGDSLVKLRGLRIDLDEVGQALLQAASGSLVEAVVTVRGQPEFLVVHVLPSQGRYLGQEELDSLLTALPLPQYMIPASIIALDCLPATSNGKVNRKALQRLPLPVIRSEASDKAARSLTVAEGELRLIWREILGDTATSANINASTDFFTVGGSSLLLVRLQNALKERMGIDVPLQDLYYSSTLGKMAAMTSKERSQLAVETIDWDEETMIPSGILDLALQDPSKVGSPIRQHNREVVLTGATGFLGSEILTHLMENEDIDRVHCIAVPVDTRDKIPPSPKVVIYPGSLLSPTLGLSPSEVAFLQEHANQIIHAGAQGHCLNNYTSVRGGNVHSTQFLACLALPRRIPMHFISSGRVTLQSGECAMPPVSMAEYSPSVDGSQGFTATKWASEVFLEKLVQVTSTSTGSTLPVIIHRTCSLIGDRAPHDDAMNSVIRFSLLSRKVPIVDNALGYFDFKDAAAVAADIANHQTPRNPRNVIFRHHSSGVQIPFSALAARLESLYGDRVETVGMDEWLEGAVELGIEELIVSYLRANVANGAKLEFPFLGLE